MLNKSTLHAQWCSAGITPKSKPKNRTQCFYNSSYSSVASHIPQPIKTSRSSSSPGIAAQLSLRVTKKMTPIWVCNLQNTGGSCFVNGHLL